MLVAAVTFQGANRIGLDLMVLQFLTLSAWQRVAFNSQGPFGDSAYSGSFYQPDRKTVEPTNHAPTQPGIEPDALTFDGPASLLDEISGNLLDSRGGDFLVSHPPTEVVALPFTFLVLCVNHWATNGRMIPDRPGL